MVYQMGKLTIRSKLSRRGLAAIVSRLDALGADIRLHAALERRHLFTHGLKKLDEFQSLTSTTRIDDNVTGLGATDRAQRYMDLDAAYHQRWSEINELCAALAQFRFDLVHQLIGAARPSSTTPTSQ
jgi:hypothetical protein